MNSKLEIVKKNLIGFLEDCKQDLSGPAVRELCPILEGLAEELYVIENWSSIALHDCFVYISRILKTEHYDVVVNWLNALCRTKSTPLKSLIMVCLMGPLTEPPFVINANRGFSAKMKYELLKFLEEEELAWVIVSGYSEHFDEQELCAELCNAVELTNAYAIENSLSKIVLDLDVLQKEVENWTGDRS